MIRILWMSLLLILFQGVPINAEAAGRTFYISPMGNDGNPGTSERPWATFQYAFRGGMGGGDILILKDGVYHQPMGQLITDAPWSAWSMPSGSDKGYTVIKAENDGRAILENSAIYLGGVRREGKSRGTAYVRIEGLKLRSSIIRIRNSHHIKLLRTGVKNGVSIRARYGQVIEVTEKSHHVLLEDVWVVGTMRYGILVFESDRIILRRVVVRFDGNTEREPKAGICFYGATGDIAASTNSLAQNCILIDFNKADLLGSGMQNVHAAQNINYYGCIALNLPTNGFWVNEEYPAGRNDVVNSVVWDVDKVGIAMKGGDPKSRSLISRVTVGKTQHEGVVQWERRNRQQVQSYMQNSLFIQTGKPNGNIAHSRYNAFDLDSQAHGENVLIVKSDSLDYLVHTPDKGTGTEGTPRGAVILKRYGKSGTLWGEPGYSALTDEDLWPWPHEDRIHADFSEADGFDYPTTDWKGRPYTVVNDTQRGFAAPGQTLTRYIWEYLGNDIPETIYASE